MKAAVTRLMLPLTQAAETGRPVDPTWANKETLSLLYTYCTSLNSSWAMQQVTAALNHASTDAAAAILHGFWYCLAFGLKVVHLMLLLFLCGVLER